MLLRFLSYAFRSQSYYITFAAEEFAGKQYAEVLLGCSFLSWLVSHMQHTEEYGCSAGKLGRYDPYLHTASAHPEAVNGEGGKVVAK